MAFVPILGLLGLAYVSMNDEREEEKFTEPAKVAEESVKESVRRTIETAGPTASDLRGQVTEGNTFHDIAPDRYTNGLPSYLYQQSQMYVSGVMDNVGPVAREQVGPGLGVGPNTPAYGGFQQLFRVKPTNVGEYNKTCLPGRSGPAQDITGGRHGLIGKVNHKMPAKTAFLPTRLPPTEGRAAQASGMAAHGIFEKSKKTTVRSETGSRNDGLGYGGASAVVGAGTLAQDPSRNKGDFNAFVANHQAKPMPGINNFFGGHTITPEAQLLATGRPLTAEELKMYGLRPAENRGKQDRSGNAGRMNVRGNPLAQGGALSSVRVDQSRVDGRLGPVSGGHTQQYVKPQNYDLNAYKGMQNPRATSHFLGTAERQLANNPYVPQRS